MPNIAALLKAEIARVARKESKSEIAALKKAASSHRSDIAALKRRLQEMERELSRLRRSAPKVEKSATVADSESTGAIRFSAKGLKSQRARLGLSAADLGLLIGTTSQSVFNWEEGKARPRAKYLPAIVALRTLGKKTAAAHLEAIKAKA